MPTSSGRHRRKVSTIAAIGVAPGRRRVGLYWKTDPVDYIDAPAVVEFLRDLLRHLKGKVIVVRDGGSHHQGPAIRAYLEHYPRLTPERLPGYAFVKPCVEDFAAGVDSELIAAKAVIKGGN